MRTWVGISLGIHIGVFGIVGFRPAPARNLAIPDNVYSVSLVSVPGPRPTAGAEPAASKAAEPERVEPQPIRKPAPREDPEAVKPPSPEIERKPSEPDPSPPRKEDEAEEEEKPEEKEPEASDVLPEEGADAPGADAEGTGSAGAVAASALGGTDTRGSVSLDVENFGFSYYLVALQAKVASNWFPPGSVGAPGEVVKATVHFWVTADGTIEDAVVEDSSGVPYFDRCALRAILLSSPLAPLPEEFEEDELGVHFEFSHTVSLR